MAHSCGIRIAINDSEQDGTVEADSADWVSKIGNVRITGGGGSYTRTAKPWTCTFDAQIPTHLAGKVRTISVAVKVDAANTMTGGDWGSLAGVEYRVVFYGDVISGQGVPQDGVVRFIAGDQMSQMLNRRPRLSPATDNVGIRTVLADIESNTGYALGGNVNFPADSEFYSLDYPKSKGKSVGEVVRLALAGSGINLTASWEPTVANPTLKWRPDFYDTNYYPLTTTTAFDQLTIAYPWLVEYQDVGFQWADFVARFEVEGFDNGGTEPYGWAQLHNATQRARAGNRTTNLTSYINSAGDCQMAAKRLTAYQAQPDYVKLNQIKVPVEATHAQLTADGITATTAGNVVAQIAGVMLGDTLKTRWEGDGANGFGDNSTAGYADWPATLPEGSDKYDELEALWYPTLTYDATSGTPAAWTVRTVTREWNPTDGWFITLGIEPLVTAIEGADVSSYGNGTY
jgi:hypothetical protein